MKNFLRNVFWGIVAVAVPLLLMAWLSGVLDDPAARFIACCCGIYLGYYTSRQFSLIGKVSYNCSSDDAFWLSLFVSAAVALAYTAISTLYGWIYIADFSALPYAYAPIWLTLGYCSLLGSIVCGLRLKCSSWNMSRNEGGLTWSILFLTADFALCMVSSVCERYFDLATPKFLEILLTFVLVASVVCMAFFACLLIWGKNRK